MKLFELYDGSGDVYLYVARDPEHAREQHKTQWYDIPGETPEEPPEDWAIAQILPKTELSIGDYNGDGETAKVTAAKVVADHSEGFVACTGHE